MEATAVRKGALVRRKSSRVVWDVVSESPSLKGWVTVTRDDYGRRVERSLPLAQLEEIDPGTPILFRSGTGWVIPDKHGKA